jgi:hypothetical protein
LFAIAGFRKHYVKLISQSAAAHPHLSRAFRHHEMLRDK